MEVLDASLLALTALIVLSPITAAPTKEEKDQAKAELKKLEGSWKVISMTLAGKELDEKEIGDTVTFKNGEYEWEKDPGSGKITSIDPTKKPKEIDYEADGKKTKAIYKLDGDMFTDCFSMIDDDARPKDFKSTEENGLMVIVYKRVKKKD